MEPSELALRDYLDTIKTATLFQDLASEELVAVMEAGHLVSVPKKAYFFLEGEEARYVHVLTAGKAKLTQVTLDGQQVIFGYIVPGREFSVIAALENTVYPVSAQAVGDCQALVWDREGINELMAQYPRIAVNSLKILSGRIAGFQNRIRELATQRVERRIARTLLRLANQTGKLTADGVLIDLPLSRQDLAEMNGTTLYTVSRTLTKWEKQGILRSKRTQILIVFPHGLVAVAEDFQMSGNTKTEAPESRQEE